MSNSSEKNYEVGYKKPPKSTQYAKGQSGNPDGRPKKVDDALDPGVVLQEIENEQITVVLENGKRKRMTKVEAGFRQLFKSAISDGDMKAASSLAKMAEKYFGPEGPEERAETETELLTENEILARDRQEKRRKKPAEPVSRRDLFRKVAKERLVIETEGGKKKMTRWEALTRMIVTQALKDNSSATRLLSRMREIFPGKPSPGGKNTFIINEEDKKA